MRQKKEIVENRVRSNRTSHTHTQTRLALDSQRKPRVSAAASKRRNGKENVWKWKCTSSTTRLRRYPYESPERWCCPIAASVPVLSALAHISQNEIFIYKMQ